MAHYIVDFNPIAISYGQLVVPWYWLVYFAGYLWLLWQVPRLARREDVRPSARAATDFVILSFFAMILCARLVYVLIYNFSYYQKDWTKVYQIWEGGMSFHGGLLGVFITSLIFARQKNYHFAEFTDLGATVVAPILFFGRLANFINGELAGRVSNVAWAMIFPRYGDGLARHPSQLYEALLEGVLVALIMWRTRHKLSLIGHQSGQFLLLYGGARFMVEFFRAPDVQLGLYLGFLTMGQILCLVMISLGILMMSRAKRVRC